MTLRPAFGNFSTLSLERQGASYVLNTLKLLEHPFLVKLTLKFCHGGISLIDQLIPGRALGRYPVCYNDLVVSIEILMFANLMKVSGIAQLG